MKYKTQHEPLVFSEFHAERGRENEAGTNECLVLFPAVTREISFWTSLGFLWQVAPCWGESCIWGDRKRASGYLTHCRFASPSEKRNFNSPSLSISSLPIYRHLILIAPLSGFSGVLYCLSSWPSSSLQPFDAPLHLLSLFFSVRVFRERGHTYTNPLHTGMQLPCCFMVHRATAN